MGGLNPTVLGARLDAARALQFQIGDDLAVEQRSFTGISLIGAWIEATLEMGSRCPGQVGDLSTELGQIEIEIEISSTLA